MFTIGQQEVLFLLSLATLIFVFYNLYFFIVHKEISNEIIKYSLKRILVILGMLLFYPIILFLIKILK
ncbi:MAG: hypothetical protein RL387_1242 [Bacteroidota bacterium]|jgi:hypothetical protein